MSLATGDARFLSWGVYLEPYESIDRIRYILYYDIRNHKLLLINNDENDGNQQPSSYDFTCVSQCKSSSSDETELILDLDNTKQSYTVNFYFDSEYDRDCNYKLLISIINQNILQIAPNYGINADLEIGCQIQKIYRKDTNKNQKKDIITSEWKPRILSLVQNRILLFRDKTIDYHPLLMISINAASFRYYKTELYDHTVQIWLSNNLIYQFHLGDKKAMNALNGKLRSALSLYNQYGLNRFHPEQIAPKHLLNHLNNDFNSSDDEGPDLPKSAQLKLNLHQLKLKKNISPNNRIAIAHPIIANVSPSAKTEITQLTQQNEKQTEEAVFKAHEYMQSESDHAEDEESSDEETDTESADNDPALNNSDSDDPKIAKPETTIFTFRASKKLKSRPLPPRPISTTAGAKPENNVSINLPNKATPARISIPSQNNKPSPSTSHQLTQLSPITPSKRERRLSEPDYGTIFSAASANNGYRYHHTPHYSNQTECKLQQPISPVFDQDEVVKHVAANNKGAKSGANTPTLLQQSTQPSLDGNTVQIQPKTKENINHLKEGNINNLNGFPETQKINALTLTTNTNNNLNEKIGPHFLRNQSRNLSLTVNEPDIARRKSTKKFEEADIDGTVGNTNDIQAYGRGSIDNLQENEDNKPVIFNKGFMTALDGKRMHHSELDPMANGAKLAKIKDKVNMFERQSSGSRLSKSNKKKSKNKTKNKDKKKRKKKMKRPSLNTDVDADSESVCSTFIESGGWDIGQCKTCGRNEKDHDFHLGKKKKNKIKPITKILQRRNKSGKHQSDKQRNTEGSPSKSRPDHDASGSMQSGLKRRSALVIGNESTIRKAKEKVTPKRASSFLPRRPLPVLPMDKTTSAANREKEAIAQKLSLLPSQSPRLSNQSISEPYMNSLSPVVSSLEVATPVSMDKAKRASKVRTPLKKAEKLQLNGTGHGNLNSPSLDRLSPNMSPMNGQHGVRKGSGSPSHDHSHGSRPMSPMSQLTPPPAYGSPDSHGSPSNPPSNPHNNSPWSPNRPQTASPQMDKLKISDNTLGNPQKTRSKSTGNVIRQVKQQIRYTQKRKSTSPHPSDRDADNNIINTKDLTRSPTMSSKHKRHHYQSKNQRANTPNMQYAYSAKSPPGYPQRSPYNKWNMHSPKRTATKAPHQMQKGQSMGTGLQSSNYYQHYKNQFTYVSNQSNSPQPPPAHSAYTSQHATHGSVSTAAPTLAQGQGQGQGHGQYNHSTMNSSVFNFPTLQGSIPPPPPPEDPEPSDRDREEKKQQVKRLKALKWDRALKKDKSKINTFIWGKCNPQTMFPSFSYPTTPWNCDNLSKKQIYSISVAKEGGHCFGIGANDWCFVWGEAVHKVGVLGLGTNTTATTPFLVRTLRREKVKQTCCSAYHSLCITENMVIYAWGSKQLTLLGMDTNEPTPLQFLNGKGLKCLSACNTHSLAWNPKSIHIYSFGMSGPWLGFDDDNKYSIHKATFGIVKFDNYIYNKKFVVSQADCSSQYTIIVLNTGYVGVCGINEHGRMGIGKHVVKSGKVLWMRDLHKIVRVSCASFHSGFVDTNGKVYTTGVGNDYRLGHGNLESGWKPRLVEAIQNIKIREIECVAERTYVISTSGHLILWGKEPLTNRTHFNPFIYNYLSSYRVFNVLGAKEFAVVQGVPTKEPLRIPDIDGLKQSQDDKNKILGISSFLSSNSRIGSKSLFGSSNPSISTILPSSPQQSNAFWSNNNSNVIGSPTNDYQNPNSHHFKRHYYRNKNKRNNNKSRQISKEQIESKYEIDDEDQYENHIYRQRSEVQTTLNYGHSNHLNADHVRKRYTNKYGNAKSDRILGITASRNANPTPKMSDIEYDVEIDTDEDYDEQPETEDIVNDNNDEEEKQSELKEDDLSPKTPRGPPDTPKNDSIDGRIQTTELKDDKHENKKDKKDKKNKDKKNKKRNNFAVRLKRAKTDNFGKQSTIIQNYTSRLKRADTSPFQSIEDNDDDPKLLNQSQSLPSPTPKKCSHSGCGCAQFIAKSSHKWGKNKCKSCGHKQKEHNIQIDIKSDSDNESELNDGKRTYNYVPNHRFI